MKKIIHISSFFIIALLQVLFLSAILYENKYEIPIIIFIIFVASLLTIAYSKIFSEIQYKKLQLTKRSPLVLFVVIGATLTFYLNINIDLGPVIAAGLVGTAASFLPLLSKKSKIIQEAPGAIYCGAFVGMSMSNVAQNIWFIILAGIIAGIVFSIAKYVFKGCGGKWGTIAFVGVSFASLIFFILS